LAEIADSVGAELGRGAGLSLSGRKARAVADDVEKRFADVVAAGAALKREIGAAYAAYKAQARRSAATGAAGGGEK
jgi:hypothetical protein